MGGGQERGWVEVKEKRGGKKEEGKRERGGGDEKRVPTCSTWQDAQPCCVRDFGNVREEWEEGGERGGGGRGEGEGRGANRPAGPRYIKDISSAFIVVAQAKTFYAIYAIRYFILD
jgi:hypothetical protein